MKYIPDYNKGELQEKEFFFGVLSTLYPKEVIDIVDAAFKARKTHYSKDNDDMIALTPDLNGEIDSILTYKSMPFKCWLNVATNWRAINLLKVKTLSKKENERTS